MKHNLLKYVEDDENVHKKIVRTFTTLANASYAIKLPIEEFDEEDIKQIKNTCESWGKFWTKDFPHKNITPKRHILIFVIPKLVEKWKSYSDMENVKSTARTACVKLLWLG